LWQYLSVEYIMACCRSNVSLYLLIERLEEIDVVHVGLRYCYSNKLPVVKSSDLVHAVNKYLICVSGIKEKDSILFLRPSQHNWGERGQRVDSKKKVKRYTRDALIVFPPAFRTIHFPAPAPATAKFTKRFFLFLSPYLFYI
jgi:hypothetical protein